MAWVSAPTIDFGKVRTAENGVSYLDGDMVIITWEAEGEVQGYRIVIRDENDSEVKRVDTSDTRYIMEWSELSDSMTYTVTVTAIPRNGTLKANGVSTSAQFALYVAPEPTPTPEPLLQTGKISDSWDEIIAAIDDGSARQRYAVGATKELNLGRLGTIHMQLAGFDLDERADGSGKAATTWIAVELLPNTHVMNENWTAEEGWEDSDLRAYLQNTVLPAMPSTISKRLVWVRKKQKLSDGDIQFTEDKLWIPDRSEIFGSDALYYDLFHDTKENRVKTRNGSAAWWWLRSASISNDFCSVNSSGGYTSYGAFGSNGVALGFCL